MDGGFGFGDEINGWYIFLVKYGIIRIIMSRTRRMVDRQRKKWEHAILSRSIDPWFVYVLRWGTRF